MPIEWPAMSVATFVGSWMVGYVCPLVKTYLGYRETSLPLAACTATLGKVPTLAKFLDCQRLSKVLAMLYEVFFAILLPPTRMIMVTIFLVTLYWIINGVPTVNSPWYAKMIMFIPYYYRRRSISGGLRAHRTVGRLQRGLTPLFASIWLWYFLVAAGITVAITQYIWVHMSASPSFWPAKTYASRFADWAVCEPCECAPCPVGDGKVEIFDLGLERCYKTLSPEGELINQTCVPLPEPEPEPEVLEEEPEEAIAVPVTVTQTVVKTIARGRTTTLKPVTTTVTPPPVTTTTERVVTVTSAIDGPTPAAKPREECKCDGCECMLTEETVGGTVVRTCVHFRPQRGLITTAASWWSGFR